jgi:glycosyltransferase involved in cell wall biosynthesis
MKEDMNEPQISIGLPILNGEKFLRKRLENILTQTFTNFELIITNNASTDSTLLICKEYAEKDSRIKIFNQEKTIIVEKQFEFLLQESNRKYFIYASVDDLWSNDFLEKTYNFLEENTQYICCMGRVERYGAQEIDTKIVSSDTFVLKIYKKFRSLFRPFHNLSFTGEYEEKASKCFGHNNMLFLFGLFQTEIIKKSRINFQIHSSDLIMCLKTLEFGDVKVLEEITLKFYVKGFSSQGIIKKVKTNENTLLEMFFPFLPLTIWCKNHFGKKFIVKNLRHILWLNTIYGWTPLLIDIFKIIKR